MEFNADDIAGMNACPVCGATFPGKPSLATHPPHRLVYFIVIAGLAVMGGLYFTQGLSPRPSKTAPQPTKTVAQEYATLREKDKNDAVAKAWVYAHWDKKEHPFALVVHLVINNRSDNTLQDPIVACTVSGASGTAITTKFSRIYQRISPGYEQGAIVNFGLVSNQADSVDCRCVDATPID
ncbi:MAG: hypothetical protein AB7D37_04645 [Desulfovibrio sp.]